MADQQHLDQLKQGVETWNQWRKEHQDIRPDLSEANLERTDLRYVHLEGANLRRAHLEEADLLGAHLEEADLLGAHLEGANLRLAFFDGATNLGRITLGNEQFGFVSLVDVHWGDINLSLVDWSSMKMLGEELEARRRNVSKGKKTKQEQELEKKERLDHYRWAVRANRQLAVALREQGLSEEGYYFAYRAQVLQRAVWRWRHRPLKYALSWILDLLAGYGYKPIRSLLIYLFVIGSFTIAYYFLGQMAKLHISGWGALVYSVTSFHGRGFFPGPGVTNLDNPIIRLAALEAVIGLLVEISFIATFTQRFFGK